MLPDCAGKLRIHRSQVLQFLLEALLFCSGHPEASDKYTLLFFICHVELLPASPILDLQPVCFLTFNFLNIISSVFSYFRIYFFKSQTNKLLFIV